MGVLEFGTTLTSSGYIAKITNSTDTISTAPFFTCTAAEAADKANAVFQYYLNDASGSSAAADSSGAAVPDVGAYVGSMTKSSAAPIACSRDNGSAYVLDGSTSYIATSVPFNDPTTFSEEVWFKTSTAGGKLMGFGSSQTGSSFDFDRHLYIETTGRLDFGTLSFFYQTLSTPNPVTDNRWHHAVGTMSPSSGLKLYLDGSLVASNSSYTTPQNFAGYWRIGYDNTATWQNAGTNFYFAGQMRYAAVYSVALSPSQVSAHYLAGQ